MARHLVLFVVLPALLLAAGCRSNNRRMGGIRGPGTDDGGPIFTSDGGRPVDDDAATPPVDSGPITEDDAGPSCPAPRVLCGTTCADTSVHPSHCGGCDIACGVDELCADGECIADCLPSCSGVECGDDGCGGSCGSCGSGETCVDGLCTLVCPTGTTDCGGTCVSTSTDRAHCGGCFNACATGATCTSGTCVTTPPPAGDTCATATTLTSSLTFTFSGAVADHTPYSCGNSAARPDRAFVWTAPRSGTATFAAGGASTEIDTTIAVFSSSSCTSSFELGCDDDGGTGLHSLLSLSVTAGLRYWIVVSPYNSPAPTGTIRVTVTPP
jgi:hypothetical protein